MNEEKSKIIAELADYVRSDLPVQEIIDNFQYLIQKLDYTNRVAAITKAIERLNDGCTYDYVAAGLREWYGIDISSQELALLLYGAEQEYVRKKLLVFHLQFVNKCLHTHFVCAVD